MSNEKIIQDALVKHYARFYRLAFSYVRNEADAMDILQESAYKAILNSNTLKNTAYVETWLYRIVVNEAYALLRLGKKGTVPLEEEEAVTEDQYENTDLKRAVDGLEEQDRTLIVLRYYEDRKLDEIARIMDLNLNTVKSRLYRVLDKLKLAIGE